MSKVIKAAREGSLELVTKYIEAKPSWIDTCNQRGYTPLSAAVEWGHTHIIKYLLDKKASVDEGKRGISPLSRAVETGNVSLLRLLLRSEADPNMRDSGGWTLAHGLIAYESTNGERMFECFVRHKNFDINARILETANSLLHFACSYSKPRFVDILLRNDSLELDTRNEDSLTPLLIAVDTGQLEIVKALLKKGADPNAEDHDGSTMAHRVFYKYPEREGSWHDLLSSLDIDFSIKDAQGDTPFDKVDKANLERSQNAQYEIERQDLEEKLKEEKRSSKLSAQPVDEELLAWLSENELADFIDTLSSQRVTLKTLTQMSNKKVKRLLGNRSPFRTLYFLQRHKQLVEKVNQEKFDALRVGPNFRRWLKVNQFSYLEPVFARSKYNWRKLSSISDGFVRKTVGGKSNQARFLDCLEKERRRRLKTGDSCPEGEKAEEGTDIVEPSRDIAREESFDDAFLYFAKIVFFLGTIAVLFYVLFHDEKIINKSEL